MITTNGTLIRTRRDGHLDVSRGQVDIRFTHDCKNRGTISLAFGNLMIYADADQLISMLKEQGITNLMEMEETE